MFDRQITYEVLAGGGDRWIIDSTHRAKADAMGRAQALLAANQHDGVKITREVDKSGEEVIFQQECAGQAEKPITIAPIDEAAICETLDDLAGFEARKTIGRVLRNYFDEYNLTATELLYGSGLLRQLTRMDRLFNQAIHRVASIQARALDVKPADRSDFLFKLAQQATERTKKPGAAGKYLTIMNANGLSTARHAIKESVDANSQSFVTGVMLADFLGQERDWGKKLGLVCDMLDKKPDPGALVILDELCGEIIDGATAMKELLGAQSDLAAALGAMAQLGAGKLPSSEKTSPHLSRFNGVMAEHDMPVSRGIIFERVASATASTQPLTREDDRADRAAFPALVKDVIWHGGLAGGIVMSEALTRRARMVMKRGEIDLAAAEGMNVVLEMLPNQAVRIGYLLDLGHSSFAEKNQALILQTLLKIVEGISSISGFLPSQSTGEEIALAMNDLRLRIGNDPLGSEIDALISAKLDAFLKNTTGDAATPAAPKPVVAAKKKPSSQRTYQAGETIFAEGDPGDEAFMILSGEIEISINTGKDSVTLATLGRGEIFGEMALVDDEPRMATATARAETALSAVPQEAFKKRLSWLAEEDRLMSRILEMFVTRLRRQGDHL